MLKADPKLQLIGVGDLGTAANAGNRQRSWSQAMLEESGDSMNLISEHFYIWNRVDNVQRHVAQMVDAIRDKAERHRRMQPRLEQLRGRKIPIGMDEWNYWFTQQYNYGELGCVYQLRDALGIAAGLHEYYRNSDIVSMAHYAQTVNVIGCIKTTKTDAFFDATALPLLLYRREFGTTPLAVTTSHHELFAIDVAAARTSDGTALTIGAVNPNGEPQKLRLMLNGLRTGREARVWRIAGSNPQAFNTADGEPIVIREETSIPFGDVLTIPPYSVNLYRVPLE
jgi:alpha-N-arabinofuranosidase